MPISTSRPVDPSVPPPFGRAEGERYEWTGEPFDLTAFDGVSRADNPPSADSLDGQIVAKRERRRVLQPKVDGNTATGEEYLELAAIRRELPKLEEKWAQRQREDRAPAPPDPAEVERAQQAFSYYRTAAELLAGRQVALQERCNADLPGDPAAAIRRVHAEAPPLNVEIAALVETLWRLPEHGVASDEGSVASDGSRVTAPGVSLEVRPPDRLVADALATLTARALA